MAKKKKGNTKKGKKAEEHDKKKAVTYTLELNLLERLRLVQELIPQRGSGEAMGRLIRSFRGRMSLTPAEFARIKTDPRDGTILSFPTEPEEYELSSAEVELLDIGHTQLRGSGSYPTDDPFWNAKERVTELVGKVRRYVSTTLRQSGCEFSVAVLYLRARSPAC